LPVDVLVPAATAAQITAANASRIRARLVVEGANGPVTHEADAILWGRGITVVPDIVANAGGLVVSYFEWVQNIQRLFWDEEEVNERLRQMMVRAFRQVAAVAREKGITLREAAMTLAVERVVEAIRLRGLYP
jgi:glutamate dehydrogenase (NAD(P)+)